MQSYPIRSSLQSRRSAFTLIELLTVIAIIGILAAIIIPTVGRVRDTAKKAQCVARLRQWGNVVSLCSNDYKGHIPLFFKDDLGNYIFDPYITSNKMLGEETKSGATVLNLKPTQAFTVCPNGLNNDNQISGNIRQYSFVIPVGIPAARSARPFGMFSNQFYYKQGDAAAPAQLFLMIEQNDGQSTVNVRDKGVKTALASPGVRRVQLDAGYVRHGGIANVLYLDGHVGGLTVSDTDYDIAASKEKLDRWTTLR
jgi:prepilin-type N-terminal cleavage/methylation domain-containing protein/prepilin-type processing-associated H-X9-DG protein